MHKGILILFFGPDGSGKTTLAKLLKKRLIKNGLKIKISWVRGTHTLSLILALILSKFSNMKGNDNFYFGIKVPKDKRLWQFLEFISALPILLLKYELPLFLGYTVIGERSHCDLIAWIATTSKDPEFIISIPSIFLLKLASKRINFYITANANTLINRRKNEVSEKFIITQLKYYNLLYKLINAVKIETDNKKVSESLNELLSAIKHYKLTKTSFFISCPL
ncbi:MAG: hypothetical protein QW076_04355 [Candidatus Anstonellales archaeon]